MKSVKNHLSLVIALLSILFSMQVFIMAERSIEAYKVNLANNYSIIAVSQKQLKSNEILSINKIILKAQELSPDSVIKRLSSDMKSSNVELLKLTLPKFYKITLAYYPTPQEIKQLRNDLLNSTAITKVEDFSHTHDTTYKLLLLFKNIVTIFAAVVLVVTILLIFKELRIWQYKHNERMSIMGLFGAALWLRSAVLFRLAIVDALIASFLAFGIFTYLSSSIWIKEQFEYIGINIVIFNPIDDFLMILGVAMSISIILASLIVLGHKEEA
ncbi:MAG: cell division protein FtsX [Sulfurimonas sp. RIFOXYD12_FULL_33_39]|uniref:FtsX-like permease family protein n=1 Tax=unclassified Sulfurimonas TaxID=2623549 RepID=UPI0008B1276F|nr:MULTISPECIES: FtsX-like permease family protein [unclassified Sulfurimonas]OHE01996.1 MAG: cell division protein FtsX [Sulfurimonas sp. RIFCSPLOWO2_12_FULL_34_6]OHE08904.1 MAG: cell division protein FtsX [Sulfurimonas sp. RIFOXYD12_FULL_33_39]OHE14214.1 MAG: cell division protein FtsX [Sulfurimonas sp. RIFOXYD2_FULL_34_21]DAB27980.1 MAG TPA: cell division protein FtsX [Sulfurimonas sp. UBA10385]